MIVDIVGHCVVHVGGCIQSCRFFSQGIAEGPMSDEAISPAHKFFFLQKINLISRIMI